MNHKSLHHNIQAIRACLYQWSKEKIVLGSLNDWSNATHHVQLSKDLIHLVRDSCSWLMEDVKY
jgi:hypothetical protein